MGYRHTAAEKFHAKMRPAKIGTIPMVVVLDGRCTIAVGKRVRWKESIGGKWETGVVDNVEPLRIERM